MTTQAAKPLPQAASVEQLLQRILQNSTFGRAAAIAAGKEELRVVEQLALLTSARPAAARSL